MTIYDKFIDVNKYVNVPLSLKPYVNFEGVYPPETFDGHIDIFKNYYFIRNYYRLINTVPRDVIDNNI